MNKYFHILAMALSGAIALNMQAQRIETTLNTGWEFTKGRPDATTKWQSS